MDYGLVYRLTNTVNGKVYIGQTTKPLAVRWASHVSARRSKCRLVAHAILKYGPGTFKVEALGYCPDRETLDEAERLFIEVHGSLSPGGYNLSSGGESAFTHSPETCQRKSEAHRRRYQDQAQRERQSRNAKIHWARPEVKTKAAQSQAAAWTPEARAAQSARTADSGRAALVDARKKAVAARSIPVAVYPEGGGEPMQFKSCTEACRALGLDPASVSACINGKNNTHKGFRISPMEKN